MSIQRNVPDTENSEQTVLNRSVDKKYDVIAVELMVENDAENALVRLKQSDVAGSGSSSTSYQSYNDTTTDANLVYLGKAEAGSDPTDAVWQIKRYNKSAGTMTFADDITTFTKQWSARTGYGY